MANRPWSETLVRFSPERRERIRRRGFAKVAAIEAQGALLELCQRLGLQAAKADEDGELEVVVATADGERLRLDWTDLARCCMLPGHPDYDPPAGASQPVTAGRPACG